MISNIALLSQSLKENAIAQPKKKSKKWDFIGISSTNETGEKKPNRYTYTYNIFFYLMFTKFQSIEESWSKNYSIRIFHFAYRRNNSTYHAHDGVRWKIVKNALWKCYVSKWKSKMFSGNSLVLEFFRGTFFRSILVHIT